MRKFSCHFTWDACTASILLLLQLSCSTAPKKTPLESIPIATGSDGLETLVLLGTNDIHGAIAGETLKTKEAPGVTPVEYPSPGVATLSSYVKVLRSEFGKRLFWLDAGDEFQGSIESNLEKGKGLVRFFNYAGLDGAAIGNHEFDFGPETDDSKDRLGALKTRMSEAKYPYLASNIVDRNTKKLAEFPNTYPSKLYMVGSLKVGVIGLSTLDTPKTTRAINITSLLFSDLKDATLREAQALREKGADLVLMTSHIGLFCEPGRVTTAHTVRKPGDPQGECGSEDELVRLLRSIPAGTVDAVVAGHSHSIVHHWVAGVPVVQAGVYGRYANLIYLTYDRNQKKVLADRTRIEGPIPVCSKVFQNQGDCDGTRPAPKNGRGPLVASTFHGKTIEPDSGALSLMEPTLARAAEAKKVVVGEAARPLELDRFRESSLGNFVADAVRSSVGADLAIVNAGGIRAPLPEGKITFGDVFRVLPFDNYVVTLKVTGKELLSILRVGESGSRGYSPTAGLKLNLLDWQYDAPSNDLNGDGKIEPWEGNRLLEVRLPDGSKIKENKTYSLATIDFLVSGGDDIGWALLKIPGEKQTVSDQLIRDAAIQHLKNLMKADGGGINSREHPLLDPAKLRVVFEKPKAPKAKGGKRKKKRR